MFRKVSLMLVFYFFINLSVANDLQGILKKYNYKQLSIEGKGKFKAPYMIAKVNDESVKGVSILIF